MSPIARTLLHSDPTIGAGAALQARVMQAVFPFVFRRSFGSPEVQFATKPIAKPTKIVIPTRHGEIEALVYKPTDEDIAAERAAGRRPPVHFITHGGGFIVRRPQQEDNVARYLASELGAYVVLPDFDTAPTVVHPVSEQQADDAFVWVHEHGEEQGWDGERLSIGGASAGTQVAFAVVEQAIDAGGYVPVALSSEFGVIDLARADELRTSPLERPVVGPQLMQLIRDTYFVDANLSDPLVSPSRYGRLAEFPPTLILTAEHDTLLAEMHELAEDMTAKGVEVTYRQFDGVHHGFTHAKPAEVARQALTMIGEHLRKAYAVPREEERNVAVVRRFIDGAVNGGDLAVIDDTWAEEMTWHGGSLGTIEGREAYKAFVAANTAGAFADMHLEVHEVIAHGDKVVVRFTNSATNVGSFMNRPATGKHADWLGTGIYTVRDGRITEGWFTEDILGMLIQLDAIAPAA
jgi:acetyl esterase/lipase/predicted ester cyclase